MNTAIKNKAMTITNMVRSLTRLRRMLNIVIIGFFQLALTQLAMIAFMQGCGKGDLQTANNFPIDTLHKSRNKAGEEVSTTQILIAEKKELLRLNAGKDSTLRELQKIVKQQNNIISATILKNTTINQGSALSEIVRDSVNQDTCSPVYKTEFKDKWREVNIVADKDSIRWTVKDFNDFEIVQKYQKKNLFARKIPVIEITNKNPYTETRELKPFVLKERKQRKGLIFLAGIITGLTSIIILK